MPIFVMFMDYDLFCSRKVSLNLQNNFYSSVPLPYYLPIARLSNQLLANLHGAQNLGNILLNAHVLQTMADVSKISSFLVDYRVQYQSLVSKKFSLETKLNAFTVQETFVDKGIISEMNFKTGSVREE